MAAVCTWCVPGVDTQDVSNMQSQLTDREDPAEGGQLSFAVTWLFLVSNTVQKKTTLILLIFSIIKVSIKGENDC